MKRTKRTEAAFRALEKVQRAAVDVTNEVAIEVDEPHWTPKERALMRAIERYEDLIFGTPARLSRKRGERTR